MKKRFLASFSALAVLCSAVLPQTALNAQAAEAKGIGTTYYVSTLHGKDSNNGMSEETPFYSLQRVNDLTLQPGDQVLLECGSIFLDGYLHLYGQSGSEEAPIVIDKYGVGRNPIIDTNGQGIWYQNYGRSLDNAKHAYQGYVSSAVLLYDTEYIEINNLEIINKAPAVDTTYNAGDTMNRTGVAGVAQDRGTIEHIYLNNLNVHDVQGNVYDKHMNNGGIYFTVFEPHNEAATGISRYDDVKIENCIVERTSRWGIAVGYTAYWGHFPDSKSEIPDEEIHTYGSANVAIRNNYVKDVGGDAITLMYCDRPLVEYNVSDGAAVQMNRADYLESVCTQRFQNAGFGRVAAAIWPWKCKDALFQYNECFDTRNYESGNGDGQAWDADSGDGTVYQYNYSHNNTGGCVMFCYPKSYRNTFRYNISQNDLAGALDLTSNPDAHIYNNVFYMKEGVPFIRADHGNGAGKIENNIIYYAGSTPRQENWRAAGNRTYDNNLYYNYANKPSNDGNAVEVSAGTQVFQKAGSAPAATTGVAHRHDDPNVRSVFDGYKLSEDSPAIGKGKEIVDANGKDACTVDFFGNELTPGQTPDLGVHQYQEKEETGIPEAPQKVVASEPTENAITLSWPAVEDPMIEIVGYKIMDGSKVLKTVTDGTAVTLDGLEPGKEYTLSVVAYDAEGYESARTEVTFTTCKKAAPMVTPEETKLLEKVQQVNALKQGDYTAQSWQRLQAALAEVKAALADGDRTAESLGRAYQKLDEAVNALQKAGAPVKPSLTLDRAKATIYTKGQKTVTLKAILTGVNQAVKWTSSKPKVAAVKNGKVTAKKAGKTIITAEAGAYKAVCTITVKKPTLKLVKKSISVKAGKKAAIKVKATPKGKITYKSSNKKVATVTKKGVVKGVKAGTCKITVKCNGVKKILKVKVK